ncbi:MAG: AraC family transcriptional regulator [Mesorhizobium sp.]|nr:MAG: AraC family transcriptional regulator [Mesorhizobium sp.]RWC63345.1 MAG: AraC family transcriptional regulator [Mesorhizobium sp.]
MKNTDDARESGDSRGVNRERTARYVLDIIPESAGPRRATARGSAIYSARGPASQRFLAKGHSTGMVLRPVRRLRTSLGSDRITEYGARRVREYLDENFARKVMVAELACVAGPNHFIARFAATFGMPPHRYLINSRLDLAERLLAGGELPIAEIAYLTGFSDQSHLAATMKKYRGRTPTGAGHASLKS